MKEIHYLNIGMAKAGTTSIFDTLMTHPDIDFSGIKENYSYLHYGASVDQYSEYYKKFNVSLNFCPILWSMEQRQIVKIDPIVTHYSIIFRNPYQFIRSLYYFTPKRNTNSNEFIDMMIETNQLDYAKILTHWELIVSRKPFKIMYFDDLQQGTIFYDSIIKFLNLSKISLIPKVTNVSNVTQNIKDTIIFSSNQKHYVNSLIEKFERKMNKNLNHWKINV